MFICFICLFVVAVFINLCLFLFNFKICCGCGLRPMCWEDDINYASSGKKINLFSSLLLLDIWFYSSFCDIAFINCLLSLKIRFRYLRSGLNGFKNGCTLQEKI